MSSLYISVMKIMLVPVVEMQIFISQLGLRSALVVKIKA